MQATLLWFLALAAVAVATPAGACSPQDLPLRFQDGAGMRIGVWAGDCDRKAPPPACLGPDGAENAVYAVAEARFAGPDAVRSVLGRLADVAAYPSIRYWSSTRERWRPLVTSAEVLATPQGPERAGNLDSAELAQGAAAFVRQEENTPAGTMVYRLAVEEAGPDRLTLRVTNARPATLLGFTLFDTGAYSFRHSFRRLDGEAWLYHGEFAVRGCGTPLVGDKAISFATRLAAVGSYLIGRPEGAPPRPQP